MKKVGIALAVLLLLGAALLSGLKPWGFAPFGVELVRWAPDAKDLERMAWKFLEDLKYKDFAKAAKFHSFADQGKADIPALIERLFAIKPEQLNLRDYTITGVDLDEDGKRARTHFHATYEVLNSAQGEDGKNEERQIEGILYWHKLPASEALPPPPAPAEGTPPAGGTPPAEGTPAAPGEGTPPAGTPPTGPVAQAPPPTPDAAQEAEQWFMKLESSLH